MATWKQLVKPNLDPVIYQSGSILYNWLGYCLAYVQHAFGTGWAGSSAWGAWSSLKTKYANRTFPKGVYFLVWFSHWGTYYDASVGKSVYKNWGHVAICYVDSKGKMKIWSSPASAKPTADTFTSIAAIEKALNCKYVGWSKELAGKKLIEEIEVTKPKPKEDIMKTNLTSAQWQQFIEKVYQGFNGSKPKSSEVNFHLKNSNPLSFVNGFKSFKWQSLEKDVTSLKKDKTALQTQVKDLNTALKKAQAKLDEANYHVPEELHMKIDKLTAENAKLIEQAQSTADDINQAYVLVGGWLAKVIKAITRGK